MVFGQDFQSAIDRHEGHLLRPRGYCRTCSGPEPHIAQYSGGRPLRLIYAGGVCLLHQGTSAYYEESVVDYLVCPAFDYLVSRYLDYFLSPLLDKYKESDFDDFVSPPIDYYQESVFK